MSGARGRSPGFRMGAEHRTKIANSKILNRLIACAEGEIEMTSTQAQVAIALMKKVMPDLTHNENEHTGLEGAPLEIRLVAGRGNSDD